MFVSQLNLISKMISLSLRRAVAMRSTTLPLRIIAAGISSTDRGAAQPRPSGTPGFNIPKEAEQLDLNIDATPIDHFDETGFTTLDQDAEAVLKRHGLEEVNTFLCSSWCKSDWRRGLSCTTAINPNTVGLS